MSTIKNIYTKLLGEFYLQLVNDLLCLRHTIIYNNVKLGVKTLLTLLQQISLYLKGFIYFK